MDWQREFLGTAIVEVQVLQTWERATERPGKRAVVDIQIEVLVRKVRMNVVEDAVHDDVNIALMTTQYIKIVLLIISAIKQ